MNLTHLGNNKTYKNSNKVDSTLLEKVERSSKIADYNIYGIDRWNCYEFSCLVGGERVREVISIVYSSDSDFIIESKSLKLYLNTFNFVEFLSLELAIERIRQDLAYLLSLPKSWVLCSVVGSKNNVKTLDPEKLNKKKGVIYLDNLTSNCKITNQPDWGSVLIETKQPNDDFKNLKNLIRRYLDELSKQQHFHEEICEIIYSKIREIDPDLPFVVTCFYTRRGGIDINPVRSNRPLDTFLIDTSILIKTRFQ